MTTVARVIPCLDVDGGRVVKGVNFVDLADAGDPVELAARYDAMGADEVVFLDITASSAARDTMVDVVARTAEEVFIPLTVGGGVRSVDDARRLLRAGADKVSVNTAAIERPELVSELSATFGAQCVVVAIDARRGGDGYEVFTHGGRRPSLRIREGADTRRGEASDLLVEESMLGRDQARAPARAPGAPRTPGPGRGHWSAEAGAWGGRASSAQQPLSRCSALAFLKRSIPYSTGPSPRRGAS